ncbi:hypothetical protein C8Q76DRAFT_796182 [Earliella scabrosa]|nr:hypothetical protein C8Q76DRAFT_796182 [Earliella scabrosa]
MPSNDSTHQLDDTSHSIDDAPNPMASLRVIPLPRCTICKVPTIFSCARCTEGAYYCGPQHFVEDWCRHKQRCTSSELLTWGMVSGSTYPDSGRTTPIDPSAETAPSQPLGYGMPLEETAGQVVGLLAHPFMKLPQFVQVRLVRDTTDVFSKYPVPVLYEFFSGRCGRTLLQFGRGMRFLGSPFHMFYCVDAFVTNSYPNEAIKSLTRDVNPSPRPWPGTVLVLKVSSNAHPDYIDIRSRDLLDVREYFVHFQ